MGLNLASNTIELINEAQKIRIRSGITLTDLKDRAFIDAGNLSRIENLKQGATLDTFCRFANALGYKVTLTKETYNEDQNSAQIIER